MKQYPLLAGAGRAAVEWLPGDFPLEGFAAQHDPLAVRAVLLRAEAPIALLSFELTSLPPQAVARFRAQAAAALGIPPGQVLVSVTHTFSAPHLPRETDTPEAQRLADVLYARLCAALDKALAAAQGSLGAAQAAWGSSPCGLNVNRNVQTPKGWWLGRDPRGYSDHTLRCLTLYQAGRPLAALLNYDCQPSVLDQVRTRAGQSLISGDMAGEAMRVLEQKHPGLVAVYLPGAAGDQAPLVKGVETDPEGGQTLLHEDAFVVARAFGQYLAECAEGPIRHSAGRADTAAFGLLRQTVQLPGQVMRYSTRALTPHTQYEFIPAPAAVAVPLVLLRLAGVPLLLTAPELNSGYGQKLRGVLGQNALIATLVDGAAKYLPEESDFARITYTAMNTGIGRGADEAFLAAVRAAADKLPQ